MGPWNLLKNAISLLSSLNAFSPEGDSIHYQDYRYKEPALPPLSDSLNKLVEVPSFRALTEKEGAERGK